MQLPSNLSLYVLSLTLLFSSAQSQLLGDLISPPAHAASKQPKAGPWRCGLAQDGSGLAQKAYCCNEDKVKRRFQEGRLLEVTECTAVPEDQNVQCAQAANVWCCYSLTNDPSQGSEWMCTSVAQWKPDGF
ncbi:hypothetical protein TMatcc_006245 [Talaromyces marneffei ATCC 18224]|uniref:Hydrophobin n=1 Tax=Talaromyces marneffei (strain ATCC 18224 / CBS 334.59 / QM 7333) TaxID=441960 RepID=B6QBW6_TALMQ|nr:uncharacterized protein EYB26_002799 [Talaromyces marneffei]EEA25526.1 hypothetical protein PMAA_066310 [Talaromyces marneffei ATCC 18224]KAE8554248.1 hypothetical protein EYB25_002786 [Talaromyces marneffei]QGA15143.1 hypothetical protein EYB26_002799 [Talaromyces marneffei]